jgi:hypothetical protein
MDPKAVIAQVKQGNYPANWRVYQGIGNYGCASVLRVFSIICILFFFLYLIMSWGSMNVSSFLATVTIILVPWSICFVAAHVSNKNADAQKRSVLVLLPEGIAGCYVDDLDNPFWLYFPNIHNLELAQNTVVSGNEDGVSSRTFYWLDVYDNDGTYIKWQIRNCFGDTASLYKTIVGAYNHYRREGRFIV